MSGYSESTVNRHLALSRLEGAIAIVRKLGPATEVG